MLSNKQWLAVVLLLWAALIASWVTGFDGLTWFAAGGFFVLLVERWASRKRVR
jgi:hypothetical protein